MWGSISGVQSEFAKSRNFCKDPVPNTKINMLCHFRSCFSKLQLCSCPVCSHGTLSTGPGAGLGSLGSNLNAWPWNLVQGLKHSKTPRMLHPEVSPAHTLPSCPKTQFKQLPNPYICNYQLCRISSQDCNTRQNTQLYKHLYNYLGGK